MKFPRPPAFAFLILAFVFALFALSACQKDHSCRWVMINVSPREAQADCHLIELPDGRKALIDVGEGWDAEGVLLNNLKARGVDRLNLVVISHFHRDHYGKLLDVLKAGIKVDRVAVNLPATREIADVEKPWGCDWENVQELLRYLADHRIPYFTPRAGERLMEYKNRDVITALDVVCLFDGLKSPVGRTDINDTSIILRLTHGKTRALFTGDLNSALGAWLAKSDLDLKADLLKAPHHGTEGLAPNEFFERVAPQAMLVPSPQALWYSDRSKRPREWCKSHHVAAYVNGVCGDVAVEMTEEGYQISTERPLS